MKRHRRHLLPGRVHRSGLAVAIACLGLAGCLDRSLGAVDGLADGGAGCVLGTVASCACPSGPQGTRTCGPEGDWGACGCSCGDGVCDPLEDPDVCPGDCEPWLLAAGGIHTCAARPGGQARCWGSNANGQLGNGTFVDSAVAVAAFGIDATTSLSSGLHHACALTDDGRAWCWGWNGNGQVGDGTQVDRGLPTPVSGLEAIVSFATGGHGLHTCALLAAGAASCWGYNASGQLGAGLEDPRTSLPVAVSGLDGAVSLSAGSGHSCAARSGGAAQCWGANHYRQLGDGTETPSRVPVPVQIDAAVRMVSAGGSHSCAVLRDGTVTCWGWNNLGQLGDGSTQSATSPVIVGDLSGVATISTGYSHTCAVTTDGAVYCWGDNGSGELGSPGSGQSSRPVRVEGIGRALVVSAGSSHTCVGLADRTVRCFGSNDWGALGDGTFVDSAMPVRVVGLE